MDQKIPHKITISDFFTGKTQYKISQIFERFVNTQKIEYIILELIQEISSLGINDNKSIILQEDLINILIYYTKTGQNIDKIFEVINENKMISFFRKILKKHSKYYIKLDRIIAKLIESDEDKISRTKVEKALIKGLQKDLKNNFMIEMKEATNIMTFLDNKKLETEEYILILGNYLDTKNIKK